MQDNRNIDNDGERIKKIPIRFSTERVQKGLLFLVASTVIPAGENSIMILLFLIAFLAFSVSAVCGGGAGLLLMPLLSYSLPVTQVPAALSIGTAASSLSRIAAFYRNIRWDVVRWFVPAALPAVLLGAWLLKFINPLYLEMAMGLFLLGNLPMLFRKKVEAAHPVTPGSNRQLVIIGFFAGFLSGLTGAVGLLFNRFYLKYGMSKEEIVATRAANEIVLHVIKLVLYGLFGLLTARVLEFGLVVAVAGMASSYFMRWGIKKVSEFFFRRVGYAAMVLSGISVLWQSTVGLMVEKKAYLTFLPISNGVESKLQWQGSNLSIEFEYDEGFEYEKVIPFSELPHDKQAIVKAQEDGADRVVIEEVFGFNSHSYEAYFFNGKNLVRKIDV